MMAIGSEYRRFGIKEHGATYLHWDFRLEDEVKRLLSLASHFPPNLNPNRPIKMILREYHQLEYLLSERIIREGVKKPGPTAIWDMGVYKLLDGHTLSQQLAKGIIRIFIVGQRLNGIFSLRHVGPRAEDWLWTKEWDDFVDVNRTFANVLTPEKIGELEGKVERKNDENQILLL